MKNNKEFPLSLEDINSLLGNNESKEVSLSGFFLLKVKDLENQEKLLSSLSDKIFKVVYDVWNTENGVVVGKDKLLTQAKVIDCEIVDKAEALNGWVAISARLKALIEKDPAYAQELKDEVKVKKNRM